MRRKYTPSADRSILEDTILVEFNLPALPRSLETPDAARTSSNDRWGLSIQRGGISSSLRHIFEGSLSALLTPLSCNMLGSMEFRARTHPFRVVLIIPVVW